MQVKKIAITGGAGQIAYSLLFRIANGDLLGKDQPVALHILEIPEALEALNGVKMELQDCAFPLLQEVRVGSDPEEIFEGVHYAFLVGSKPRGPGMERADLLLENGKIFVGQGKALNKVADRDVKVLVVGNPCNTNCLIAMTNAPDIPRKNFHAMTRLDHNRALGMLAEKAQVSVGDVTNMIIWGNHSTTQVPDFYQVKISGKSALDLIGDEEWLKKPFIERVQKRGAEIIQARGKSSAASAASAAIDAMKSVIFPTKEGEWFSSGVCSDGNPYGIAEDLIFSFPCRCTKEGSVEIVSGISWNSFIEEKVRLSEKELLEEKSMGASK